MGHPLVVAPAATMMVAASALFMLSVIAVVATNEGSCSIDGRELRELRPASVSSPNGIVGATFPVFFKEEKYHLRIGLGTPPRVNNVILDTGSEFCWIQCELCDAGGCYDQTEPIFSPTTSSTYSNVSCSDPSCRALWTALTGPVQCGDSNVCKYVINYGIGGQAYSRGRLARETLSPVSSSTKGLVIQDFVFGCGSNNRGYYSGSSGIFGIGRHELSFTYQLASKLGNMITFCLPSRESSSSPTSTTGYLTVSHSYDSKEYTLFTPMLRSPSSQSLYGVNLSGISIGGKTIAMPEHANTILDSGTSISLLPSSVYNPLKEAVRAELAGYESAPAYFLLDTCFKGSHKQLPNIDVELVFDAKSGMHLQMHNIFADDLSGGNFTCLAFASSSTSLYVIGSIQQQTIRFVYDLKDSKIGIGSQGCS